MSSLIASWLDQLPSLLLLIFGFGFVIFWHELGHFLAAKWADVRVEQFAVGFGHALLSWRKGLGFRLGTSTKEYERRVNELLERKRALPASSREPETLAYEQFASAARELGISETEYRLNWLPLGGYVKMLGQDDLNPNAQSADPRSYNMKSIGKRMVIVSAGVVMNIILAIIGFTILFRIGFDVPPPVVGAVMPGSPAQRAGIEVGDRIISFDSTPQRDFTKIHLNVALVKEGQPVPIVVQRPDGTKRTLTITAQRSEGDSRAFLQLGILPSPELRAPDLDSRALKELEKERPYARSDVFVLNKGDTIRAVNGQPVSLKEYYKLDEAVQNSDGRPVHITVAAAGDGTRELALQPHFAEMFEPDTLNFAGLQPRTVIDVITDDSSAKGKLLPGDAIISMTVKPGNDTVYNPTRPVLRERLQKAGSQEQRVDMRVSRDGKEVLVSDLVPNVKLQGGMRGLGIQLVVDEDTAVVGGVLDKSAAYEAGIHVDPNSLTQTTITSIASQPIKSWRDIQRVLSGLQPGNIPVTYTVNGAERTTEIKYTEADLADVQSHRYTLNMQLHDLSDPRRTSNPLVAVGWGLEETRDLIVQFYQTLQRMLVSQSVSPKNLMGPVGIFTAGTKFAYRGTDWLIWFLSMISANLAVVNFLPIPIVDGGLFTFLVIEKIQGKPISPKIQSIAQVVGLALILSIFVLVTIQDITR
jgi:regulator of sigma E protease